MMDTAFTQEFKGIEKNLNEIVKELQRLKKFENYEVFSKNYDAFSIIEENLFYYIDSIEDCIGNNHHEFDEFKYTYITLFNDLREDYKQGNLLKLISHYKTRLKNLKKITLEMKKKLEKDEKELLVELYTMLDTLEKFFSQKSISKYEKNQDFTTIQKTIDAYYQKIFSLVRELFLNYGYNSITFKKFLNKFEKVVNSLVESCIHGEFFEKKDYFIKQISDVVEESKKIKKG